MGIYYSNTWNVSFRFLMKNRVIDLPIVIGIPYAFDIIVRIGRQYL